MVGFHFGGCGAAAAWPHRSLGFWQVVQTPQYQCPVLPSLGQLTESNWDCSGGCLKSLVNCSALMSPMTTSLLMNSTRGGGSWVSSDHSRIVDSISCLEVLSSRWCSSGCSRVFRSSVCCVVMVGMLGVLCRGCGVVVLGTRRVGTLPCGLWRFSTFLPM